LNSYTATIFVVLTLTSSASVAKEENIFSQCGEKITIENYDNDSWARELTGMELRYNNRKFKKTLLRKSKEALSTPGISSSSIRKKRKIEILLPKLKCKVLGKFRLTGDLADHFGKTDNEIPHSILVNLKDGNLSGMVNFKLFNPVSRNGSAEVINTILFRKLGFLAPRTALIKVLIGNSFRDVLFQEVVDKHLLEKNNFHEGYIFEGDERLGLGVKYAQPRVSNKKLLKNKDVLGAYLNNYQELSNIFLKSDLNESAHKGRNNPMSKDPPIIPNSFPQDSRRINAQFILLTYAVIGERSLSKDDHRLAYDRISRKWLPIYYDGHSKILEKLREDEDYKINFDFDKSLLDDLITKIENINIDDLHNAGNQLGANLSREEITRYIKAVQKNLFSLKSFSKEHYKVSEENINLDRKLEIISELDKELREKTQRAEEFESNWNPKFIWTESNKKINECSLSLGLTKCAKKTFDSEDDLKKYLLRSHLKPKKYGIHIGAFDNFNFPLPYLNSYKFDSLPNITIKTTANILPSIDKENKIIKFILVNNKKEDKQIIFSDGQLIGWEILFDDNLRLGYKKVEGVRYSKYGYTGCLTFNDMLIQDVKVKLSDTNCEDAIHVVRSKGNFNDLEIINSLEDGLDSDFSRLSFNRITIKNTGNDCLDFSRGDYYLKSSLIENCGDKGVSAGESSIVTVDGSIIRNSLIAVASKDSSKVRLKRIKFINNKKCLSAYRKKSEFSGGFIENFGQKCPKDRIFTDKNSKIIQMN